MSPGSASGRWLKGLVSLLVDVQRRLDEDLDLGSLASRFGYSPFHFHRLFSTTLGETPKTHVNRLRLERAAYLLAITDEPILGVGLSVGFKGHETFSRAFRRRFGYSPSGYRQAARRSQQERLERNQAFRGDGCWLSEVRFERWPATPVLSIRRLGLYSEVDPTSCAGLWDELVQWAGRSGVPCRDLRLGLFPDDPGMTPGALQQSDICIPIERAVEGSGGIRCMDLAGGVYGVIEHIGPYLTVDQAYRNVADGVRRSGLYTFTEGPPIQIFRTPANEGDPAHGHSQVCFPVRRKR